MDVIKVGGAVLRDLGGFDKFAKILGNHKSDNLIIVVSAFSLSTRELSSMAHLAAIGDKEKAIASTEKFIMKHIRLSENIIKSHDILIQLKIQLDTISLKLYSIIEGVTITKELSARILDLILSFGELFALTIIDALLTDRNYRHKTIDSTSLIISDNTFGNAKPIETETQDRINKLLIPEINQNKLILTQGFVAATVNGDITTMGIESSNLTAAILAKMTGAKRLTLWTDVRGIRSADPKIVDKTKLIKSMSYSEAYTAGALGLKLIYPGMIDYAKENNIELIFRSAFDGHKEFTTISKKSAENKLIICSDGYRLIEITPEDSTQYQIASNWTQELINNPEIIVKSSTISSGKISILIKQNGVKPIPPKELKPEISESISQISTVNIPKAKLLKVIVKEEFSIRNLSVSDDGTNSSVFYCEQKYSEEMINLLHKKLI